MAMKLGLVLFSLSIGSVAAIWTVDKLEQATAVVQQAIELPNA